MILGFCTNSLEIMFIFCIVVLHATLYRRLDRCLGMLSYNIYITLQCFDYYISYKVELLNSSIFLSETELVIRYDPFVV